MARSSNFAYDIVRSNVLSGVYPPGSHLREAVIANEIGVSRTPVREALRRLASDGFVTFVPNQGAFVAQWSVDESRELIEVRAELASIAAAGAALHATQATIDQIAGVVSRMERLEGVASHKRVDEQTRLNVEFQELIFKSCGNRWIERLLRYTSNVSIIQRTYHAFSASEWNRAIERYHDLITALRTGDASWAGAILKAHFLASRHAIATHSERRAANGKGEARKGL